MGYQEALFAAKEMPFEDFKAYIAANKSVLENPPSDYCKLVSTIRFKKSLTGSYYGSGQRTFKEGSSYIWAVGQRSAVNWLPKHIEEATSLDIDFAYIEYVPEEALRGFAAFIRSANEQSGRGVFENDWVVVEPLA